MAEALVRIENLSKYFQLKQPFFDILTRKPKRILKAVDGVDLTITKGETMGLVGESGCGKSTLAKTVVRLYEPDGGRIFVNGKDISTLSGGGLRAERHNIQMIFQDPYSSLNPRLTVNDMLREVFAVHKICSGKEIEGRILNLLDMVGINRTSLNRYPGEFSGGQRQRIGIARALALSPEVIIADEPVSALDVSIQAQILNLLSDLQRDLNLTMLFISHDLRIVRYITKRVAVMYLGKIVELSGTEEAFDMPLHPYTDVLIKAAPVIDPGRRTGKIAIEGELPSPIAPPPGCRFHPRCPFAKQICRQEAPGLKPVEGTGRLAACHFPLRHSK